MNKLKKSFNASPSRETARAFCKAAKKGDRDKIRGYLAQYGADVVNKRDGQGNTALMYASWKGHNEIVRMLLENRACLEAKDFYGSTPLMHAAMQGHKDIVRLLLEKGADVLARNKSGDTALKCAGRLGFSEVADMLKAYAGKLLEERIVAAAGPLRREIPAPKVIRFPQPKE